MFNVLHPLRIHYNNITENTPIIINIWTFGKSDHIKKILETSGMFLFHAQQIVTSLFGLRACEVKFPLLRAWSFSLHGVLQITQKKRYAYIVSESESLQTLRDYRGI